MGMNFKPLQPEGQSPSSSTSAMNGKPEQQQPKTESTVASDAVSVQPLINADLPSEKSTVFYPDEPIVVSSVNVIEREVACDLANDNNNNQKSFITTCCVITFTHHGREWSIQRTEQQLKRFRYSLACLRAKLKKIASKENVSLPKLPVLLSLQCRALSSFRYIKLAIKQQTCKFFDELLLHGVFRENNITHRFLECNYFTFLTPSNLPFQTTRNAGKVSADSGVKGLIWQKLGKRWLFATDSYYGYLNKSGTRLLDLQLVDASLGLDTSTATSPEELQLQKEEQEQSGDSRNIISNYIDSQAVSSTNSVTIKNLHRDLTFQFNNPDDVAAWSKHFETIRSPRSTLASEYCQMLKPNRSFAPVRDNTLCRWFICGRDYMQALAEAIELHAREQIFITDWWMSPEILLKRPTDFDNDEYKDDGSSDTKSIEYWQLDRVLQRKAEQGVRVYVLLYKEVDWAMGLNSKHTKTWLQSKHKNIKVMRHPDHWFGSQDVFMWSHHEKIVCIDQRIAFVGGIDLCFGRWEYDYRLTDAGNGTFDAVPTETTANSPTKGEGPDDDADTALRQRRSKQQQQRKVSDSVSEHEQKSIEEQTKKQLAANKGKWNLRPTSRLGWLVLPFRLIYLILSMYVWHTIINQLGLLPKRRRSAKRKLRRLLKFNSSDGTTSEEQLLLEKRKERRERRRRRQQESDDENDDEKAVQKKKNEGKETDAAAEATGDALKEEFDVSEFWKKFNSSQRVWPGKDYYNELRRAWAGPFAVSPYEDYIDRKKLPRLPWQDICAQVFGAAAYDVARHFIERWNAVKVQKRRSQIAYPFLVPKSVEQCRITSLDDSAVVDLIAQNALFHCRTQTLRSVCTWSGGIRSVEDSIQQAYVTLIQAAQKFIYMENQFFVTFPGADEAGNVVEGAVMNSIGEAIVHRLRRAHAMNEDFHIYIVIPLLPAIEGKFGTVAGAALQSCVHYVYSSINRPPFALFERLRHYNIPVDKYITFSSLRAFGFMPPEMQPVTEIIYVHSKLMVVDDYVCVIGSANINDRSMLGARDSEVCVLYRDREFYRVGGEHTGQRGTDVGHEKLLPSSSSMTGCFGGTLRRQLWSRWLNVDMNDARMQCGSRPECIELWRQTARNNTNIYQELFACNPSDTVRTFAQLREAEQVRPDGVDGILLPGVDVNYAKQKLKNDIRGFLVEFPLEFLAEEDLTPVVGSKERFTPAYMFT